MVAPSFQGLMAIYRALGSIFGICEFFLQPHRVELLAKGGHLEDMNKKHGHSGWRWDKTLGPSLGKKGTISGKIQLDMGNGYLLITPEPLRNGDCCQVLAANREKTLRSGKNDDLLDFHTCPNIVFNVHGPGVMRTTTTSVLIHILFTIYSPDLVNRPKEFGRAPRNLQIRNRMHR